MLKPLECRKTDPKKGSPLPKDFLKMVKDVFATNFDEPLKKIAKLTKNKIHFQVTGQVFPEEIVLCVSLIQEKSLSATSVYGSVDFDPKASTPNIQDLLPLCVDAIGTVYQAQLAASDAKDLVGLVEGPLGWIMSPLNGQCFQSRKSAFTSKWTRPIPCSMKWPTNG